MRYAVRVRPSLLPRRNYRRAWHAADPDGDGGFVTACGRRLEGEAVPIREGKIDCRRCKKAVPQCTSCGKPNEQAYAYDVCWECRIDESL